MTEKIYFKNSRGDKLVGIYQGPSTRAVCAVILCHGLNSSKESLTYEVLEKNLSEKNIATLRFDFWGHGESDGQFAKVTVTEAIDDILQAENFLRDKGYEKIGLVGASFGGSAAFFATHASQGIKFLGLKSPVSSWSELVRDYAFHDDAVKYDAFKIAVDLNIPVMIVHGTADKSVPVDQSRRMARLLPNCDLNIIEGADHRYTQEKHFEEMVKFLTEFITRNNF